jgi:short chain dehydrogenase
MTIADKTVLVTGANRGIGQALVAEVLRRGATRVYAGTRQPLAHPDGRVTPLTLDVISAAQIQAAAGQVEALDILINNAGVFLYDDLSDRAALEHHLAVNLFGPWGVTQAFLPLLARSRGAIINNVSLKACGSMPSSPAPPTPTCYETSISPRPPRNRSREPSSTQSTTGRRTSSPIPCHAPWLTAGAAARPRRSSARMRPSLHKSPSSHKQPVALNWNAAPNMLARHRAQSSDA